MGLRALALPAIAVLFAFVAASCCPAPGPAGGGASFRDGCLLRDGYQQLPRPKLVQRRSFYRPEFRRLLSGWLMGLGDRYMHHFPATEDKPARSAPVHEWARDNDAPVNAQAIWLTRDWQDSWGIDRGDLIRMSKDGVVPVLMLYYFGDEISPQYVLEHRDNWYLFLMKVAALAAIDHPVLVVIEPEYNDETNDSRTLVVDWPGFNEVVIDGIYLLRSLAPNLLVGICPGDFGVQDLELSMGEIAQYSDFVAFQAMRASTRPNNISHEFEDVTENALAYSYRLQQLFDKPILLAYTAVSTYDQSGDWAQFQADVITNLFDQNFAELVEHGVFGVLYFMAFDDPQHVGYFGEAEKHFGLADVNGATKPGWDAFAEAVRKREKVLYSPRENR
ncbi:MAG: hypothetical protein FJ109_04145 [Deltaproteobacteria bacterium]|nr:hypothetical protein [Deltaproteobacteria bacterium]